MTEHQVGVYSFVGRDVRSFTDQLRKQHRVVKNELGQWVLLTHADVVAAAQDDRVFSSAVSHYLQIPNGLDGQVHTTYRALIERYMTPEAIQPFVPIFKAIAENLVRQVCRRSEGIDAVYDLGALFAVRAQCAWLGWPAELENKLLSWMKRNHLATRSREQAKTRAVAREFDDLISMALAQQKNIKKLTITKQLCNDRVYGQQLERHEVVSILRNWTSGDLGSMALCIAVLIAYIARAPEQPELLRQLAVSSNQELELFIDEVIRLDNPFIANRRLTTCPVHIAGQLIPKGAQVSLNWTSANRDSEVFSTDFNAVTHASNNLVYGIGKHVCPGRTLATWQLRIFLRALLREAKQIKPIKGQPFVRELAPVGGYQRVPVIIH